MENAAREIYWNIDKNFIWLMYVILGVSVVVAFWGFWKKIQTWRRGKSEPLFQKEWVKRLFFTIKEILFQSKTREKLFPGLFHSMFFWSFLALSVVTTVVFLEADFKIKIFHGWFYLLLSLLADIAGAVAIAGILIAIIRRWVIKPPTIERRKYDWLLYLALLFILLSGFILEGLRIAVTEDPWANFSPVGLGLSKILSPLIPYAKPLHAFFWWSHLSAVAVLIATMPWSRLLHIFTLPVGVFFRNLSFKGSLPRLDIEKLMEKEDFSYGLIETSNLTWKQRMDIDICIGCGRCEEVCPSAISGGFLSPRKFISELKSVVTQNGSSKFFDSNGGKSIDKNLIWYCRTCHACSTVCPTMIEHVRFMVELRQGRTMMEGDLPVDASRALESMRTRGNPWGPQMERMEWLKPNEVRVLSPGEKTDILYWLGCCTSYDQTKQKIAVNMVKILKKSGVDFAILGDEELCCGDPARILGDESIFQETVKKQLDKIQKVSFNKIITHCPHCYHVLKNEYKTFGANLNVLHHSEYLYELLSTNKITLKNSYPHRVTYHDPCYLGRYQGIYELPRKILRAIPEINLIEMNHHHSNSLCCGGGGGHYWMDLKNGVRPGEIRVEEASSINADMIAVGCVYCLQMLDDALKSKNLEEKIHVEDIASIVAESIM